MSGAEWGIRVPMYKIVVWLWAAWLTSSCGGPQPQHRTGQPASTTISGPSPIAPATGRNRHPLQAVPAGLALPEALVTADEALAFKKPVTVKFAVAAPQLNGRQSVELLGRLRNEDYEPATFAVHCVPRQELGPNKLPCNPLSLALAPAPTPRPRTVGRRPKPVIRHAVLLQIPARAIVEYRTRFELSTAIPATASRVKLEWAFHFFGDAEQKGGFELELPGATPPPPPPAPPPKPKPLRLSDYPIVLNVKGPGGLPLLPTGDRKSCWRRMIRPVPPDKPYPRVKIRCPWRMRAPAWHACPGRVFRSNRARSECICTFDEGMARPAIRKVPCPK